MNKIRNLLIVLMLVLMSIGTASAATFIQNYADNQIYFDDVSTYYIVPAMYTGLSTWSGFSSSSNAVSALQQYYSGTITWGRGSTTPPTPPSSTPCEIVYAKFITKGSDPGYNVADNTIYFEINYNCAGVPYLLLDGTPVQIGSYHGYGTYSGTIPASVGSHQICVYDSITGTSSECSTVIVPIITDKPKIIPPSLSKIWDSIINWLSSWLP